jgi:hypothetical protein
MPDGVGSCNCTRRVPSMTGVAIATDRVNAGLGSLPLGSVSAGVPVEGPSVCVMAPILTQETGHLVTSVEFACDADKSAECDDENSFTLFDDRSGDDDAKLAITVTSTFPCSPSGRRRRTHLHRLDPERDLASAGPSTRPDNSRRFAPADPLQSLTSRWLAQRSGLECLQARVLTKRRTGDRDPQGVEPLRHKVLRVLWLTDWRAQRSESR